VPSATPARSARRSRATSERRLLQAFAELIIEKGVQNTTLTDIGQRAGYSHTLVVHLFGSKTGLLNRLTANVEQFYVEWITKAGAGRGGADALTDVITTFVQFVNNTGPNYRVNLALWSESLVGNPDLAQWRRRWDKQFRSTIAGLVRRGVRDGSIRSDVSIPQLAAAVIHHLEGIAVEALAGDRPTSPRSRAAQIELLQNLLRG
jgi:AcrR family transcriptional regulator